MNDLRKRRCSPVYLAGLLIAVACLAYNVVSYDQDIKTAPRAPNSACGNVIPYNNHGTTVYLTRKQYLIEQWGPVGWLAWWVSEDEYDPEYTFYPASAGDGIAGANSGVPSTSVTVSGQTTKIRFIAK